MTTLTHTSILSTALAYLRAELCVLPALAETKQPRFAWREFQKRKPTPENLLTWFSDSSEVTLCILTGAVSGNLEMLDFDAGGPRLGRRETGHRLAPVAGRQQEAPEPLRRVDADHVPEERPAADLDQSLRHRLGAHAGRPAALPHLPDGGGLA